MILIYPNNFFEFRSNYRGENHIQCFGDHFCFLLTNV